MSKIKLINKVEFDLLPQNEKIIAICKDVLARMDVNLIIANSGMIFCRVYTNDDPKTYLNQKSCEVCAKGGILSSWVANFNNYTWDEIKSLDTYKNRREFADKIPKELSEIFGRDLLDQIEVAFEGAKYSWNSYEHMDFAYMFGPFDYNEDKHNDEEEYKKEESDRRLRLIMENIIKNEGKFVSGVNLSSG